jgi:ribonuclease D
MAEDRPRNRIVRDEHLARLAELEHVEREDIEALLPRTVARRYADDLLAAHDTGSAAQDRPPPVDPPLGSAQNATVRALREMAQQRAEALGIAPELLGRKREAEACVRHFAETGEPSPVYSGWRAEVLGDALLSCLDRGR